MSRLIVIGAGVGGYEAALRAAQLGLDVVLVERGPLGGTCLNVGCIPTKTLWKIADLVKDIRRSQEFGIEIEGFKLNEKTIRERKINVVDRLVSGIEFLINSYDNLRLIQGSASFVNENTVQVETADGIEELSADHILVATGSKDYLPPIAGVDLDGVMTSTGLLALERIPESMVVIGGGVIGLEFASIYAAFGSRVTVMGNELLGSADGEISKRTRAMLKSDKLKFELGVRAEKIEKIDQGLRVSAKKIGKDKVLEAEGEIVLVATGRAPNTDGLGADNAGIQLERGGVVVDQDFKAAEGIYAIGDCVYGNNQLAHVASAQGIYVVEKLAGLDPKINLDIVPAVVFALPEIAQVGKTEEKLKEEGISYVKEKFLYQSNGKAVSLSETDGFVKILASEDLKEIYGAHIIGYDANALIHFAAIAMNNHLSVAGLSDMIWAHPTVSEVFKEATHLLEGKSVNSPKR